MALSKVGKNQVDQSAELTVDSDLTVDTDTLYVDSTNNRVGVGTTTPTSVLHSSGGRLNGAVLGASSSNAPLYLTNDQTNYGLVVGTSASDGHVWLQSQKTDGTATAYNITLNEAGGNVGVGLTNPAVPLHVKGYTNQNVMIVDATGTSPNYIFDVRDDGTSKFRVDPYGHVIALNGSSVETRISAYGQLIGGVGAVTTGGTTSWNDSTNARSGNGYTLLLGSATGGPGGGSYYHSFTFEYSSKDGTGNMTQWAIGYANNARYMRYRYGGTWSSWSAF